MISRKLLWQKNCTDKSLLLILLANVKIKVNEIVNALNNALFFWGQCSTSTHHNQTIAL